MSSKKQPANKNTHYQILSEGKRELFVSLQSHWWYHGNRGCPRVLVVMPTCKVSPCVLELHLTTIGCQGRSLQEKKNVSIFFKCMDKSLGVANFRLFIVFGSDKKFNEITGENPSNLQGTHHSQHKVYVVHDQIYNNVNMQY